MHKFGNTKVYNFRARLVVLFYYQDIGRLQVTVNNALVVGIYDRITNFQKKFQPVKKC